MTNEEKSKAALVKEQRAKSKEDTKQLILKIREQSIQQDASQKRKDDIETQEFIIGERRTTIKKYLETVSVEPLPYIPTFTNETGFYRHIYRLRNLPIKEADDYAKRRKRRILSKITKQIIYGRFEPMIYAMLNELNPLELTYFTRKHKMFQNLTEDGRQKVIGFIKDAVDIMKTHTKWNEFTKEYCTRYNIAYQGTIDYK